jgi:CheY-like chemotaxis protein
MLKTKDMPRPIRILIAEDEPGYRLLLERALSKSDFDISVHSVSNGREAIDYLKRISRSRNATGMRPAHPLPTLLLLDLKMPEVNGFEVLKWVRKHPRLRDIQVVVFTASEEPEDMRHSYEAGADAYIVKPQDPHEFMEVVRSMEQQWLNVHATPECGCVAG